MNGLAEEDGRTVLWFLGGKRAIRIYPKTCRLGLWDQDATIYDMVFSSTASHIPPAPAPMPIELAVHAATPKPTRMLMSVMS